MSCYLPVWDTIINMWWQRRGKTLLRSSPKSMCVISNYLLWLFLKLYLLRSLINQKIYSWLIPWRRVNCCCRLIIKMFRVRSQCLVIRKWVISRLHPHRRRLKNHSLWKRMRNNHHCNCRNGRININNNSWNKISLISQTLWRRSKCSYSVKWHWKRHQ